jgi:hypothetical protein
MRIPRLDEACQGKGSNDPPPIAFGGHCKMWLGVLKRWICLEAGPTKFNRNQIWMEQRFTIVYHGLPPCWSLENDDRTGWDCRSRMPQSMQRCCFSGLVLAAQVFMEANQANWMPVPMMWPQNSGPAQWPQWLVEIDTRFAKRHLEYCIHAEAFWYRSGKELASDQS